MNEIKIKRALVAVYDKTGITEFARALVDEFGIEIISTGGTAKHLKAAGVPVTMVEEVTGFPEMLDGRVKTLHPKIHAAILADRDNPEHMRQLEQHGIKPIDMVVVNLYPFEKTVADPNCTFEQAIEMIDIGGPTMLRAAAKNHGSVLVVCETGQFPYDGALVLLRFLGGCSTAAVRLCNAAAVFDITCHYDAAVSGRLASVAQALQIEAYKARPAGLEAAQVYKEHYRISYEMLQAHKSSPGWINQPSVRAALSLTGGDRTRYGENPSQQAAIWWNDWQTGLLPGARTDENRFELSLQFAGYPNVRELSFNNYVDADAALSIVKELSRAEAPGRETRECAVVFIKHSNACGCAVGDDPVDTYRRAYLGDPIAAAGGVLCMNFRVTREIADMVMNSFGRWGKAAGAAFFKLDVWIAIGFDQDAIELITTPNEKRKWGKECRLVDLHHQPGSVDDEPDEDDFDIKKIAGGLLVQTRDLIGLNEDQWKVVTKRAPTEAEMSDLRFAWLVCKHTKSNAITICRDRALLGNGAGQMSRVKSCDVAIQLARENGHGDQLKGAVAAGDAFFPVPDGPQKLIDAGITAIIHPGGSNRDADTVAACDAAGVAMIVTGTRHFKH